MGGKNMKTPTLMVSLVGLYLLGHGAITLLQLQKIGTMGAGMGLQQNPVLSDVQFHAIIELFLGLGATVLAGRLALILTLDSGPDDKSADL